MKGDGEQRAARGRADVWEGASPGAQVELLASRGIRATLGPSGPQVDLAAAELCVLVATGAEGAKSLDKLTGQHGALASSPRWIDGPRRLYLFRRPPVLIDAVNLHGAVAGVSVIGSGSVDLPPAALPGGIELRWSPKDHPAHVGLTDLPAWLAKAALDPIEAHRAWDSVTAKSTGQVRVIAEWERELVRERGRVVRSHGNLCTILRRAPSYAGRLTYDEMAAAPRMAGKAMSEGDFGAIVERLERDLGLLVSPDAVRFAVACVAEEHKVHPVRDYLTGLRWDGTERLGTVAGAALGAEGQLAGALMGRWFLSAAARPLRPGCKVDTALVLVGPQGARKSSVFSVLTGEWFSDTHVDLASKDAFLQLAGTWVMEWGEIERVTSRKGADEIKAFLSSKTDKYRPPYGRSVVEIPRSCVIVGSTNQPQFLEDETGSRRFWCVRVGKIDLELLRQWRDQLWAEAVHLVNGGERWWLEADEDAEREGDAEQHAVDDAWGPTVREWLGRQSREDHTAAEVLSGALDIPRRDHSKGTCMRLARVLREIGCERRKHRPERVMNGRKVTGEPTWCWFYEGTREALDGDGLPFA